MLGVKVTKAWAGRGQSPRWSPETNNPDPMVCKELRGVSQPRELPEQTQADAPVPAEVTNSPKHLRHRTNLFLKHFSKKGRNHPTSSKLCPQVEGLQTWEWGGRKGGGVLSLSEPQ